MARTIAKTELDTRHVESFPTITATELCVLRAAFEEMMRAEPMNCTNFVREGEGYASRNMTIAWHCIKCGYLAGVKYNRVTEQ